MPSFSRGVHQGEAGTEQFDVFLLVAHKQFSKGRFRPCGSLLRSCLGHAFAVGPVLCDRMIV